VGSYQRVRILAWHVHGSWMTSFVQGPHSYLVPVLPERGPHGLGRARTCPWPDTVAEVPPQLRGRRGRRHALGRFGVQRFLQDREAAFAQMGTPCAAGPSGAVVLEGERR